MTGSSDESRQSAIEEAVRQFVDARWQGQAPDIEEFTRQYPGLDREIRQGIRDAQRIDALFDSLVQADQSDFKGAVAGDDLAGQTIGGFEVVEMIGRGGMGVVYLARDTKLDRSVAIKSMPAKLVGDSITQMRFGREAKLLASLNHPNIAVIHNVIEQDEGAAYLILEYIPGDTLAERIAREPLKLEEALSIGLQVAKAVSAAHREGVAHRDLKPSNIKITPDGRVKVLDFGLAKPSMSEGKGDEVTVTDPGRIIGTPAYMSPEQARGKETDQRTDIWSFGCIMYEMLTGQLPFEGETATDTLAHIIEREPDWDLLPRSTPESIRMLLQQCLNKDLKRRLRDITDATSTLDEAMTPLAPLRLATVPTRLRKIAAMMAVLGIAALGAVLARHILQDRVHPSAGEIRLIVLPFENLGPPEDDYHADIVTAVTTACLDGIRGMRIVPRRSAMRYRNKDVDLPHVAEELGLDYILEGTIHRERPADPNSQVTITPVLIRASDDTQVWSWSFGHYPNNVLRLQSELAEQVAQALDIALPEPTRHALGSRPTASREAYLYYLGGNDYMYRSPHEGNFKAAIQMYRMAVESDPAFTLAYAQLSRVHCKMYWYLYDRSDKRLADAKQALDRATQLDPDLPEVHLARGEYCYHGLRDYEEALEQFAFVRRHQPDNRDLLTLTGAVQRQQERYEDALANMKEAHKLDPLSGTFTILPKRIFQLRHGRQNQMIQALGFYGFDIAFGVAIQIWASGRKFHRFYSRALQDLMESLCAIQRISIMD